MTALLTKPLPFTIVSADADTLYPATNANMDEPGLVWRKTATTMTIILDLGASVGTYDTVALVGSNITGSNSVAITTGASNTGVGTHTAATQNFATTPVDGVANKCIYYNATLLTQSARYVKIVITATGVTYLQIQRIVIGKSVVSTGIDIDPEQSFVDQSVITEGPGWFQADEYAVVTAWKCSVSWVSDSDWRTKWVPFFVGVGAHKGFLFVPNYEGGASVMQTEACFGRCTTQSTGKHPAYDLWTAEIQMMALSA